MRLAWLILLIGPLLMVTGCHDCDRCEELRYDSDSDRVHHHRDHDSDDDDDSDRVHHRRDHDDDDDDDDCDHDDDDDDDHGVVIWRFPYVEIAIDPCNPRSVGVRVADDYDGRAYVDVGVNWDD